MAKSALQSASNVRPHPSRKRFEDRGSGAPCDMEPGKAVAADGALGSTFGPAHGREPAEALRVQPPPHLAGGEVDIGLGPPPRPPIVLAIETCRRDPVAHRELMRVANAEPALFRRIHHEQTAERPERLAAKALLPFLIEEEDMAPGIGRLRSSDEPGETGADDDHVSRYPGGN